MNEVANQLAQSLFKKNSLQECSRWELEILADKYPYFGIAQFLLASKLREENSEAYKKQLQKTSLYFTNPLWLDYTLNNEQGKSAAPVATNEITIEPPVQEEQKSEIAEEHARFAPKPEDADVAIKTSEAESVQEETGAINEPIVVPVEIENTQSEYNTAPEPVEEKSPAITEEATSAENLQAESIESKEPPMKIAPLKMEPLPDLNAPLVFEALHTVDYFASQGIKLKNEDLSKDRFGQQLKSFTEWLKTLKKVPPTEIAKQVDKGSEDKVITLAEHSIENRDVVTETMAEVWAKQGNTQKAIDVYTKLSLQNPAKSSYFATLIEQLKKQ